MKHSFLVACLLCIMQQLSAQTNFTVTSATYNTSARPAISAGTISGEIRGLSLGGASLDDGLLRLSSGGGTNANTKSYIDLSGYTFSAPERLQNIVLGTSGTERMRIDYNGNIGIGTSTPASRLNLDFGSTRNNIMMTSDGDAVAYSDFVFGVKTSVNIAASNVSRWYISHRKDGYFSGSSSSSLEFYGAVQGGGYVAPLALKTNGDVVLASPYGNNVTRSGNVGIGTISPTEKLSVNGTLLAKKVRVSQAAADWPDYVFDSAYLLPSLNSVSSFLKENKHLPDIPSASTIEKEGHDLGEMQKLLLKKVEEMTLYIIAQDKKIENLNKQNEKITGLYEELKNTISSKNKQAKATPSTDE